MKTEMRRLSQECNRSYKQFPARGSPTDEPKSVLSSVASWPRSWTTDSSESCGRSQGTASRRVQQNRFGGMRSDINVPLHKSRTTSPRGRQQQISASPFAGGSSGSGSYSTLPDISAVSQVWQTPVRQDHRTGTSHASASSSRLPYFVFQGNVSPLRAKETCGPRPAGSAGKCGE